MREPARCSVGMEGGFRVIVRAPQLMSAWHMPLMMRAASWASKERHEQAYERSEARFAARLGGLRVRHALDAWLGVCGHVSALVQQVSSSSSTSCNMMGRQLEHGHDGGGERQRYAHEESGSVDGGMGD